MSKSIFLDTNTFLHYQDFDRIDWLEVVQSDAVTIVIPPVTTRELNQQKDSSPRVRVKKRAASTIKKLFMLLESDPRTPLPTGVDLYFEDRDPSIDFAAHQLNWDVQDDHLIASIISYRREFPNSEVVLVTSDAGLTLVAKAKRYGIATIRLPDSLKLPEEPDPDQERIKALEQENRELKLRMPRLSLTFEDGSQHATFTLEKPVELTPEEITRELDSIRDRYPKVPEKPAKGRRVQAADPEFAGVTTIEPARLVLESMTGDVVPPSEITRYNSELDMYYQVYSKYLRRRVSFENRVRNTIKLEVWLANVGTVPAEDVDAFLHFPDGFILVNEDDFPNPPQEPQPPRRPQTPREQLAESIRLLTGSDTIRYLSSSLSNPTPPNVSSTTIRRTSSYDVEVHVERVKHNLPEPFDPLFLTFLTFDSAQSFHIDYRLLAANVPSQTTGQLHVIVTKEPGE